MRTKTKRTKTKRTKTKRTRQREQDKENKTKSTSPGQGDGRNPPKNTQNDSGMMKTDEISSSVMTSPPQESKVPEQPLNIVNIQSESKEYKWSNRLLWSTIGLSFVTYGWLAYKTIDIAEDPIPILLMVVLYILSSFLVGKVFYDKALSESNQGGKINAEQKQMPQVVQQPQLDNKVVEKDEIDENEIKEIENKLKSIKQAFDAFYNFDFSITNNKDNNNEQHNEQ